MPAKLALDEPLLPFAAVNGNGAWSPPVDVREHPAEYTVVADLPGVEPTSVEVTADGDLWGFVDDYRRSARPPARRGSSRPARTADGETPPIAKAPLRLRRKQDPYGVPRRRGRDRRPERVSGAVRPHVRR
jgi:hypothetical protein